jgi:hypothetical protein
MSGRSGARAPWRRAPERGYRKMLPFLRTLSAMMTAGTAEDNPQSSRPRLAVLQIDHQASWVVQDVRVVARAGGKAQGPMDSALEVPDLACLS